MLWQVNKNKSHMVENMNILKVWSTNIGRFHMYLNRAIIHLYMTIYNMIENEE